jgi:hypothetical protein
VPLETRPVFAAGNLPDVADRTAAHALGRLQDLLYSEYRALGGLSVARASDAAGVTRQNLVFLNILSSSTAVMRTAAINGMLSQPSIPRRCCRARD